MPEERVGSAEKLPTTTDAPTLEALFPPFDPQATVREISTVARQARAPRLTPGVGSLLQTLRHETQHIQPGVLFRDVGTVQQIGNGVARLSGLPHARIDEVVTFPTGVKGLVLNLGRWHLDVILLGPDEGIQGGDLVLGSGERLQIPVGSELLGRVVNPLGLPLDEGPVLETAVTRYLERDAPGIVEREPVNTSLHTGLKVVDALVPIGRGQRELILGDRQTGKTTLAVDTILNQADSDVFCVYVAIGQKKSSALAIIETLRKGGALAYTIVVLSSPDDPPALRYLAPYAGCTVGEALMENGHDVLVVYDDLSKHAKAYRELSLLLRRPPGREAYPGDVFYLHSRLLERAGKLRGESGGGSLTALPIVQTQRELAQYDEVAHFARFGTDVDATTQRQIQRGRHLQQVLTQPPHRLSAHSSTTAERWSRN
jgi:F-type H+-transporting ATPase subunit alpha